MRKHLFLIASVFTAFSLQAQVPTVKVAANTTVKVKPNTLFYVKGDMNVAPYTQGGKKISNEGYVKITQNLKTGYTNDDNASFVNELVVGTGVYGQLIVNNGAAKNEGKISSGVKFNPDFNFQSLGVPYTGITAGDLVREVFGKGKSESVSSAFVGYNKGGKYDANRYKNVLFFWDNDIYSLVQLAEGENLDKPERYYAVSSFSALGEFSTSAKTHLSGVPFKDTKIVKVNPYTPANSKDTNKYGEYYGSYIVDFTQAPPSGWVDFAQKGDGVVNSGKYGANIYYFGNPYTSNIDLTKGGSFTGATIYQEGYNNYNEDVTVAAATTSGVIASTPQGAGDAAKFVRPFGTFGAKFSDGQSHTITFSDEMKTFVIPSEASNILLNKGDKGGVVINQVGLDLYDANGFTGAKTYVVASDVYEAAQKGEGTEVYNISMPEKSTGIYTLQENEDGSINEDLANGKTYINGVNADKYIGKPIHLAFQNGKGKYTLKARLNESLEKNKNAFYFEDKATGKVIKIGKDFEYSFDINGTNKDRFVLYWAATPDTKPVDEVIKEEANATVVYKDFNSYKVRFDKSIKNAEVFVYSISGQLINSAKSVDTSVDYVIPLKGNTGVYIVKVVGDNGKVITKKIIK